MPYTVRPPLSSVECWQGAKYLCGHLEEIGCTVNLVSPVEGKNPIILARIDGVYQKPTVVVYGHYDVQPANQACLLSSCTYCNAGDFNEMVCTAPTSLSNANFLLCCSALPACAVDT